MPQRDTQTHDLSTSEGTASLKEQVSNATPDSSASVTWGPGSEVTVTTESK